MVSGVGTIPIIDVGDFLADRPGALAAAGAELRRALEQVGFFQIVNHGVGWQHVEAIYEMAARYHALPDEQKLPLRMSATRMGYSPLQGQIRGAKPSLNAAYFLARPSSSRNQWPDEDHLAGFRATVSSYYEEMDQLGSRLLALYSVAAGMAPEHFGQFFQPSLATLRLSHYPPLPAEEDQWGIDPHTDAGFMTMLPANPVAGLWIRPPGGDWFEPRQEPQSFVVNSGDMLRRWTNERFLSTTHRVLNRSGTDRYAIPFFYDPRVDTVIECLPSCTTADHPPKYGPITYRDYLVPFMQRSYVAVLEGATTDSG
ncbi:MAG: isopenicillin N synthase family dioxygenase [Acidimicrobiales bacterium]